VNIKSSYAEECGDVLMDYAINVAMDIITRFEGFKARAYKCPAGIWTIGWGRTGKDVTSTSITTLEIETQWLKKKLEELCSYVRQKALSSTIGESLNPHEVAALVSLIYNIGEGNFASSGVRRFLLQGKREEAGKVWLRWNKGGGKVLPGLVRRREAELQLFNSPWQMT